ncbi:FHA domain-containing protein [Nephila pilipes]|uniref:FHA domain-containing protein n=1 Tax=Nephila pilipes TaxID=299642 RepID=A0A8X6IIJ5_NEPPI|nr:FHA domain-containing protein [Nephila pilipes]
MGRGEDKGVGGKGERGTEYNSRIKMIKEKGRLYPVKEDGTCYSFFLRIKHKSFVFGSSEHCDVRIYIDGIFPKHCALTVGKDGNVFLEPMHPSALTFVNYVRITQKVCLHDNDVLSILEKDFRFAYPFNNLCSKFMGRNLSVLPYTNHVQYVQKFRINPELKNRMKITSPFIESKVSKEFHILKRLVCSVWKGASNNNSKCVSKSICHSVTSEKMIPKKYNYLCFNKQLIRHSSQYAERSIEIEKNFSFKLYESFNLRGMLETNSVDRLPFLHVFQSIWKYCIQNANDAVLLQNSLGIPFKHFYLKADWKAEIVRLKNAIQFKTFPEMLKNSPTVFETNLESVNQNEILRNSFSQKSNEYFNEIDFNIDKYNQSFKSTLTSYKKRVSIAVKRYNLRKKRSTTTIDCSESNSSEGFKLVDKEQEQEAEPMHDCSKVHDSILQQSEHNFANEKQNNNKRKKTSRKKTGSKNLKCQRIAIKEHDISLKPDELKPIQEKQNCMKKVLSKKGLTQKSNVKNIRKYGDRQEITPKLMDGCTKEHVQNLPLSELKAPRKKRNYNKKSTVASANKKETSTESHRNNSNKCLHESEKLGLSPFQRITRSMVSKSN